MLAFYLSLITYELYVMMAHAVKPNIIRRNIYY